mgnify:CR=1
MTNNAKIAAYFNIPYCEHDWSGVEMVDDDGEQMELTKCIHCPAYENGIWEEPIDFATDSGFFVLLDALKKRGIHANLFPYPFNDDPLVTLRKNRKDRVISSGAADIKTALVDATLEFIDREAK